MGRWEKHFLNIREVWESRRNERRGGQKKKAERRGL